MEFILIIVSYFILCFILIQLIRKKMIPSSRLLRILLTTLIVAILFGVGIFGGSNAEPGFALPAPIIIAFIFDILEGNETSFILRGSILPLLFWWILFFFASYIFLFFESKRKTKVENSNS
ncbi:MAG TPA: hypothetical protein VIN10_00770 [Bacteroidales bacterium]